jgi:hypothetical protein
MHTIAKYPYRISIFCIVLIGITFGMNVQRAKDLKMHKNPPIWVIDAIPPALSQILFNHDKNYTSLNIVSDIFYMNSGNAPRGAEAINKLINEIAKLDSTQINRGYSLLGPDDKGIIDFVKIAFRLFGLQVESVFYLYFFILFISSLLFIIDFYNRPSHLFLLFSFLLLHFLVLPSLAFNPQLGSMLALRAISILSLIACLHCLLFILKPIPNSTSHVFFVILQILLITFVTHIRSVTTWQLLGVALVSILATLWHQFKNHRLPGDRSLLHNIFTAPSLTPLIFVALAIIGLKTYRSYAFPIEYKRGDQIITRVFWHNIFSGMAYNPDFAERYKLRIDDVSVIRATGQYLLENGRDDEWVAIGGTSPNFSKIHWTPYDRIVGEMLFDRCKMHSTECITTVMYYKPLSLIGNLAWLYGIKSVPPNLDIFVSPDFGDIVKVQFLETSRQLDIRGFRAVLWTPVALILVLLFVGPLTTGQKTDIAIAALGATILFIGSLAPIIVGYPAVHTITEPAITFGIVVYLVFSTSVVVGIRAVRSLLN